MHIQLNRVFSSSLMKYLIYDVANYARIKSSSLTRSIRQAIEPATFIVSSKTRKGKIRYIIYIIL